MSPAEEDDEDNGVVALRAATEGRPYRTTGMNPANDGDEPTERWG
jgi:hypothetical protein